jgi:heme-degrading monooxygenase HmoA
MVVVLFRNKLVKDVSADYGSLLAEMNVYAQSQPGYVADKTYIADDGERVSIVWWQDKESLDQWRQNLKHVDAKQKGRQNWYEYYSMDVAEVYHTSSFAREHNT